MQSHHALIRIATRKSPLALWQAHHVRDLLTQHYPRIQVELVEMTTKGDKILDAPLAKIGGKGLFVKELEQGLLANEVDIAVHSMKDVPVELPPGLHLPVVLAREEPFDAFVSNQYSSLDMLPQGAVVGTASLRRQCQLLALRPDLDIRPLRGNVGTRLEKLDKGEFSAIILAMAGLKRLGQEHRVRCVLTPEQILPAIGQGAIGIECRQHDPIMNEWLEVLDHPETHTCVRAERAMNHRLQGGCQTPIAGFAEWSGADIRMRGLVGLEDGSQIIRGKIQGAAEDADALGELLAADLLAQGAGALLARMGLPG